MKVRNKGKFEVNGEMSKRGADEACRLVAMGHYVESACRGLSLLVAALYLLVKVVLEVCL